MEAGRLVLKVFTSDRQEELFIQAGQAEIRHANYPDVWRVLPKPEELTPGLIGAMRSKYTADLGAVAKLLPEKTGNDYFLALDHYTKGTDGCGVILTRFEANPNFIVITMPMRDEFPRNDPLPAIFAAGKVA